MAKNKPRPNQTPRGKEQTHTTKEENQTQMKPQEQTHMAEEEGEKITHETQIKNKPRNKPTKIEPIKYTHIKYEPISSPFITATIASLVCYLTCFVIFIFSLFLFLSSLVVLRFCSCLLWSSISSLLCLACLVRKIDSLIIEFNMKLESLRLELLQ